MTGKWALETMQIINDLTPSIHGKAFSPDWFLLRQRLEAFEADYAKTLEAADEYILALRQAWYGNPDKPSVRADAVARLNEKGSAWTAARNHYTLEVRP